VRCGNHPKGLLREPMAAHGFSLPGRKTGERCAKPVQTPLVKRLKCNRGLLAETSSRLGVELQIRRQNLAPPVTLPDMINRLVAGDREDPVGQGPPSKV